ncbi:hypothetical protein CJU94_19450 [Paraburkholderia aromaticivorans]|uniref:Bacteriophage Mu Gp45 N-terminal domain-containing protein n=1 Tax=Paraburkholderia aromaticivorans TaxID=2026199 RepID=A0A248VND4_9BURK|nr:hypothetical protein CJU94_19450 [Paraburkholderia aromaticivorans]
MSIERLFMRLRGLFGRGRVTYVDDSGPIQKMQVRANGLVTSDNRFRFADFGFTSYPPYGSDVAYGAIAGDPGNVAVIATNHQQSRPTGLSAGESMLYSQDGKYVYMTASGGIVVEAKGQDVVVNDARNVTWNLSGKLKIVAPGGVEIDTPEITTPGDIIDNSATNLHTMAQMRSIYNSHTHPVPNVQLGGPGTTTSGPNQTE